MIRILIADDHPLVLKGLRTIISNVPDMIIAGESSNGEEVMDKVQREVFDVLVVDFEMPGMDGLDVLEELQREKPTLPVLIISQHSEDQLAVKMLKAGAAGYMTKESIGRFLVDAIRLIHSGGKYVSRNLTDQLIRSSTGVH